MIVYLLMIVLLTISSSSSISSSSISSSSISSSIPIDIIAKRYGPNPKDDYNYKPNKYDDGREKYPPRRNNNDNDDNDEYYDPRSRNRVKEGSGLFSSLMNISKNNKQVGAALLGIGMILSFLGVMLFFEGNLLRLGNICIIMGIPLLLGPNRVRQFFMKESRMQASIITGLGILLVFTGRPRLGILCEIFGLLNLFGNMFPLLIALAKRFPIIGDVISSLEGNGKQKFRPEF